MQLLCTATNNPLFFVSDTVPPKDPNQMPDVANRFVSADEFKYIYLRCLKKEFCDVENNVDSQIRHLDNNLLEQQIAIGRDVKKIESFLNESLKKIMSKFKDILICTTMGS